MSKHTPGPWSLKFTPRSDWCITGADGYQILAIPHDDERGDTPADTANAQLICAAPEMFETLKNLIEMFDHIEREFPTAPRLSKHDRTRIVKLISRAGSF